VPLFLPILSPCKFQDYSGYNQAQPGNEAQQAPLVSITDWFQARRYTRTTLTAWDGLRHGSRPGCCQSPGAPPRIA
jgi:hypothetical protein